MSRILRFSISAYCAITLLAACGPSNKFDVMDRSGAEPTVPAIAIVPSFDDSRGEEIYSNRALSMIPILGVRAPYFLDQHDSFYAGATEPFSQLMARKLAERMNEAGVFDNALPVVLKTMPERGQYDIIVKGNMNTLRAKGGLYRWGLSIFADLLWTVGLPSTSRYWEIDVDFQVLDGYTGEPIGPVKNVQHVTGGKFFTRYYNRAKTTDLERKITPVLDEFIDWFWKELPVDDAQYWAILRNEGKELLARQAREAETIAKGTPATFEFVAPPQGSVVRTSVLDLEWRIAAPNGLKTVVLAANNQSVDVGISPIDLASVNTAPRTIPTRTTQVPLKLGKNEFKALVSDYRGNETTASYDITRYPAVLSPARRFALLIDANGTGFGELPAVLSNPLLGQFNAQDVTEKSAASKADLENVFREFGRGPLAGDLAFVAIQGRGNWNDLTVGDGVALGELIGDLERSLATNQVVLLLDIDWTGDGGDTISNRLQNLPPQWAFLTTQSEGGSSNFDMAKIAAAAVNGKPGETRRLTLERFLDAVLGELDDVGGYSPEAYGRYDSSITIAERE